MIEIERKVPGIERNAPGIERKYPPEESGILEVSGISGSERKSQKKLL